MSEQIPDYFKYNKENNDKYSKKKHYELAAIENDWPFTPEKYGYHPVDHYGMLERFPLSIRNG
ncbi:hypothetical protein [Paenibacillus tyrfis]|uniref:hypothetical protein n=1 Tax=Paenibacillus tyrfis TaxID=1501230 RepID=UPI0020A10DD4|nr:hypothetical protein [Paenibacillus tyrfis]MCP1310612.1 hypothetical protein [Paenibacillus tyrfis]